MAAPNPDLIYRTDQSSSLTYAQLDGNFAYLSQSIANITSVESSSYATNADNALTASYVDAVNIDGTVTSASYALSASYAPASNPFPFTGNAEFSGSILVSGSIIPNTNGVSTTSSFSLGSSTAAWKDIWVSDGTINFVNSSGQIQGTLGAGTNGTVITGSLTVLPQDTLAIDDFSQVVRLHKQQLVGYSLSLWNPYGQERNMGIYSTGYGGAFILPWDRKVSSYYLNNRIPTSSIGDGVEPWVVLPPPFNSGHGPGDIISIYNMSNSTSSLYKSSGSISVFSGWQGITDVDTNSMTINGTFNTGTLLSGSWGNYKNVNINYLSSNPSLSGSIQIAPGQKATFELVVFSANASQNVTRPSNSDLDNYFNENGYNLNQTNVNSTTIALYYLFKGIENL